MRDVKVKEAFVVSRISEDAILGMLFLATHKCSMDFARPVLRVDGIELTYTDRHGILLVSNIQVTQAVVIPPWTKTTIQCRVTTQNFCPMGLAEGHLTFYPWQPASTNHRGMARLWPDA